MISNVHVASAATSPSGLLTRMKEQSQPFARSDSASDSGSGSTTPPEGAIFVSLAPIADRSDSGGEPCLTPAAVPVGGGDDFTAVFEAKLGTTVSKQIEKYAPATLIVVLTLLSVLVVLVNIQGSLQASDITLAHDGMADADDGSPELTLSPVMMYDESLRKIAHQPRVLGSGEGAAPVTTSTVADDEFDETTSLLLQEGVSNVAESDNEYNARISSDPSVEEAIDVVIDTTYTDQMRKRADQARSLTLDCDWCLPFDVACLSTCEDSSTPSPVTMATPSPVTMAFECLSAPTYSTLTCQALGGDFTTESYCNEGQGTFYSETCGASSCGCCVQVGRVVRGRHTVACRLAGLIVVVEFHCLSANTSDSIVNSRSEYRTASVCSTKAYMSSIINVDGCPKNKTGNG